MQGLAKQSDKYMEKAEVNRIELPSEYQVGCEVCLQFGDGEIIRSCWVTKVLFSRSKVLYDIEIAVRVGGNIVSMTRIHSVDSAFVKPFDFGRVTEGARPMEWHGRNERPNINESVECRYVRFVDLDAVMPNFYAHVKWTHSGYEWFTDEDDPIKDAVQFEWREIKRGKYTSTIEEKGKGGRRG